jgi:hypothetical protein
MSFREKICPYIDREVLIARSQRSKKEYLAEFHSLERAHILG